jgi:hypothetical protein
MDTDIMAAEWAAIVAAAAEWAAIVAAEWAAIVAAEWAAAVAVAISTRKSPFFYSTNFFNFNSSEEIFTDTYTIAWSSSAHSLAQRPNVLSG